MYEEHTAPPIPFIRELCKDKPEEELLEAEDRFRRYLLLVKRICISIEEPTLDD